MLQLDQDIALRNAKNELLAVMTLTEIYEWDQDEQTKAPLAPVILAIPWWLKCTAGGG